MISGDDIEAFGYWDAMDGKPAPRHVYESDPVFQRLQWEVRAAFEAGYTAAGVDRGQSSMNPQKGKWFDHWIASKSRAFLVANGLMTGEDTYR